MALYLVRQLTSSELLQRLKTIGVKHPELCKALGELRGPRVTPGDAQGGEQNSPRRGPEAGAWEAGPLGVVVRGQVWGHVGRAGTWGSPPQHLGKILGDGCSRRMLLTAGWGPGAQGAGADPIHSCRYRVKEPSPSPAQRCWGRWWGVTRGVLKVNHRQDG